MRPAAHRAAGRLGESVAAARVPKHLRAATRLAGDSPALPAPGPVPRPAAPSTSVSRSPAPAPEPEPAAAPAGGEEKQWNIPGMSEFAAEWMFGDQEKALKMGVPFAPVARMGDEEWKERQREYRKARGATEFGRGAAIVEGGGSGPVPKAKLQREPGTGVHRLSRKPAGDGVQGGAPNPPAADTGSSGASDASEDDAPGEPGGHAPGSAASRRVARMPADTSSRWPSTLRTNQPPAPEASASAPAESAPDRGEVPQPAEGTMPPAPLGGTEQSIARTPRVYGPRGPDGRPPMPPAGYTSRVPMPDPPPAPASEPPKAASPPTRSVSREPAKPPAEAPKPPAPPTRSVSREPAPAPKPPTPPTRSVSREPAKAPAPKPPTRSVSREPAKAPEPPKAPTHEPVQPKPQPPSGKRRLARRPAKPAPAAPTPPPPPAEPAPSSAKTGPDTRTARPTRPRPRLRRRAR